MMSRRSLPSPRTAAIAMLIVAGGLYALTDSFAQTPPSGAGTPGERTEVPPRPMLSDVEYVAEALRLRGLYARPPGEWPKPQLIDDPELHFTELGPLSEPPHPADNPFSREKADLGRQLFFDPRLSGSRQIACASCHDPDLAWADGRTVAFGHDRQAGKRNTPSILNSAHGASFFWDGRAASLEEQAKQPIVNEIEMHALTHEEVAARIDAIPGYREQFRKVFGVERVGMDEIAKALATFQRTIVGGKSRFDSFLDGKHDALSDSAVRGLHLFRTSAGCINCHNGPNFTDNRFHNIGLTYYGRKFEDLGRYSVTKDARDIGRFKTPSLRNVTRTGPLMHNGLFELDGVLNLYNAGGPGVRPANPEQAADPLFPRKSPLLRPLGLNKRDLADLTAFLQALEEPVRRIRPPELPE